MIIPLRHTTTSLFLAIATFAAPALAQNAAPAPAPATAAPGLAATAATGYGTPRPAAAANARGARHKSEDQLLGAPPQYGSPDAQQGNTADAQQAALLDEQRMTVTGGQPALGNGLRNKAPGAANGKVQAAGQPGRPNAANSLMPAGAAKTTYADPYDPTGPGKHSVYRSPW